MPGTGPFSPVLVTTDMSLPGHMIYAPAIPQREHKLPVILWGEGMCLNGGDMYKIFLTEIASHGFIILASGVPAFELDSTVKTVDDLNSGAGLFSLLNTARKFYEMGFFTTPYLMTQAVDWVMRGGADKYGTIDKANIMAAGQSCGGVEAYISAFNDDRIKYLSLFNSGLFMRKTRCLLKHLKVPVAYFLGGQYDIGDTLVCLCTTSSKADLSLTIQGTNDYHDLPSGLPSLKLSLDTGPLGTYLSPHGGKFGVAAITYFKWVLKGDQESRRLLLRAGSRVASESILVKDGWNVTWKNWV
jgi:hypothetical protein